MSKRTFWLVAPLVLVGCSPGPKSAKGFQLPDGNVEAGQAAFVELGCMSCHTVDGFDFSYGDGERSIDVRLGGEVHRVRTYGELVTAIIHPSEGFARGYPKAQVSSAGKSLMKDFNRTMTVGQLIDIVAFLQSKYTEYLPEHYDPTIP